MGSHDQGASLLFVRPQLGLALGFALSRPNAKYLLNLNESTINRKHQGMESHRQPPSEGLMMLFQSLPAMSNGIVVLNTAYPGNPIIQSHVHLYVCLLYK